MADEGVEGTADPWAFLRYFVGRWQGTGTGKTGESKGEREYKFVLGEKFIQLYDLSVYAPQERNPDGEVHEEIAYLSFDRSRQKYVLREFHVEGYVNQYVLEEWDPERQKIILQSEALENSPPDMQARTTYEILGEDTFKETFELARTGQEWRCLIINEFTRKPGAKKANPDAG